MRGSGKVLDWHPRLDAARVQLMAAPLQRINLNLPPVARQQLRRLAQSAGEPEAAFARGLLVDAIERAERALFRRRLEASRTPERRARDLEIAAALEHLLG
jgi:hypothetical protein